MTKDRKEPGRKTAPRTEARRAAQPHETGTYAEAAHEGLKEDSEQTAEDVFHAFRKGRADAIEAAERTLPAVKRSVSKGTYMLCYYLSFGAVYTSELAMAAVPQDSVIRHGFKDGAAAAREAYMQSKSALGHHAPREATV